jgi:tetratricopeptide (TPR) repeat protein
MYFRKKGLKINCRKLALELGIIGVVVVGVSLPSFIPWLFAQPIPWAPSDPDEEYNDLLRRVEGFDYENGDRVRLERDLDIATSRIGTKPRRYFFNLWAKALYYYRMGNYDVAVANLDRALDFGTSSSAYVADLYELYIKIYRAAGEEDEAIYYEGLLAEVGVGE